jgi:5'-nucleotidase
MKRLATSFALMVVCAASALAANPVRISQVYGGGNSTTGTPTYTQDYVEIYNSGDVAVDIGGWWLMYGSTNGLWGSASNQGFEFPAGTTIQPCQYMLVVSYTGGYDLLGSSLPVTPDFSWHVNNLSATAGKVLLSTAANFNVVCGSEVGPVDKVGYGFGSSCPETSLAPLLSDHEAAVRNDAGNQDTDNNGADFTAVSNPVPHNSRSPRDPACLATPTHSSTWGQVKSIYR